MGYRFVFTEWFKGLRKDMSLPTLYGIINYNHREVMVIK